MTHHNNTRKQWPKDRGITKTTAPLKPLKPPAARAPTPLPPKTAHPMLSLHYHTPLSFGGISDCPKTHGESQLKPCPHDEQDASLPMPTPCNVLRNVGESICERKQRRKRRGKNKKEKIQEPEARTRIPSDLVAARKTAASSTKMESRRIKFSPTQPRLMARRGTTVV